MSLISARDNGKSFPDLTCWKRLCDLYRVPLRDFLLQHEPKVKGYHFYSFNIDGFAKWLESCRKQKGWTLAELSVFTLGYEQSVKANFEYGFEIQYRNPETIG